VFHVGGAVRISRHAFAQLLAAEVGASPDLIRAGSMHDAAGARRGADCSLVSAKLERAIGLAPVACRDGLRALTARGELTRISTSGSN
jgi:dTDP-4-dehydrorhamnose reductase